jgi:hypothetical protein
MDPEDAAGVAAGGAGLAAEAGRKTGVAEGQTVGIKDLIGMKGRQRDL